MNASSYAGFSTGHFTAIAAAFSAAGYQVTQPAPGLLQILSAATAPALVLSVGIHGDETAPIDMVATLLQTLSAEPKRLAVNLLLVIGNLAAISAAKRFIEVDLNRLFNVADDSVKTTLESTRAAVIMAACQKFFSATDGPRWHLDLHATIRPSRYATFAIIPAAIRAAQTQTLLNFLAEVGVGAVILNVLPSHTFSAFTARQCGATSATVELGHIAQCGGNSTTLNAAFAALARLLRQASLLPTVALPSSAPQIFTVMQELIRQTSTFRFCTDAELQKFMPLKNDSVIATDGDLVHRIGSVDGYLVFPNPNVQIGQRAGVIVTLLPTRNDVC